MFLVLPMVVRVPAVVEDGLPDGDGMEQEIVSDTDMVLVRWYDTTVVRQHDRLSILFPDEFRKLQWAVGTDSYGLVELEIVKRLAYIVPDLSVNSVDTWDAAATFQQGKFEWEQYDRFHVNPFKYWRTVSRGVSVPDDEPVEEESELPA